MASTRDALLENVRRYRERMKAQGFRQLNLWVPDTRSPTFAEECRRQSLLVSVSNDAAEAAILGELDAALEDIEGWK